MGGGCPRCASVCTCFTQGPVTVPSLTRAHTDPLNEPEGGCRSSAILARTPSLGTPFPASRCRRGSCFLEPPRQEVWARPRGHGPRGHVCLCLPSLQWNFIQAGAAKALGQALQLNTSLTSLE